MHRIGFGTYKLYQDSYWATLYAIRTGYRHIDTAQLYRNEDQIGQAIRDSGISRSDIFITTKVLNRYQKGGIDQILDSFIQSLVSLQTDYVDLLLLHAPVPGKYVQAWSVLEKLYQKGLCRNIGVSNFDIEHLSELLKHCRVKPYCNQIEISPFYIRTELSEYCRIRNIKIVAHTNLTRGHKLSEFTPDILLSWAYQRGYYVLPRSGNKEHIRNNLKFSRKLDLTILDGLNNDQSFMKI
jgi:diketogulonate reductase-like aldo/keto reductase